VKLDSIIPYVGGKRLLRKKIVSLMPQHRTYVELFGGAMWVLLYKHPSKKVEVYNDINEELVNLWWVVKEKPHELIEELKWYFPSRAVYNRLNAINPKELDDVKRAVRLIYILKYSFGSTANGFGRSVSYKPKSLNSTIRLIAKIADRLKTVYVENLDFEKCISLYDTQDTLFYCDPPYYYAERHYSIDFVIEVERYNSIENRAGKKRNKTYKELIILNYEPENEYNQKNIFQKNIEVCK
jgi:DNA adenine methylase